MTAAIRPPHSINYFHPGVAKAGGHQSQGAMGEALALYCDPWAAALTAIARP